MKVEIKEIKIPPPVEFTLILDEKEMLELFDALDFLEASTFGRYKIVSQIRKEAKERINKL